MKANDSHLWKEIPNSPTGLFRRYLEGAEALREIKKTYPAWLREFAEERASEEDSEYLLTAIIVPFFGHKNFGVAAFVTYCEDGFTLTQIKHDATLESRSEAMAFVDSLARICRKAAKEGAK